MKKKTKIIISVLSIVLSLSLILSGVSFLCFKDNKTEKQDSVKATTEAPDIAGAVVTLTGNTTFKMTGGQISVNTVSGTIEEENFNTTYGTQRVYGGAVYVGENATFIMDGGKIVNSGATKGGAIYVANGGKCIIKSGIIERGYARELGGAIYVEAGGELQFANGAFKTCVANLNNYITNEGNTGNAIYAEEGASLKFGEINNNYEYSSNDYIKYNEYIELTKSGFLVENCGEENGKHIKINSKNNIESLPVYVEIESVNEEAGSNKYYTHVDWDLNPDIDDYDISKEYCCGYFMDEELINSSKNMASIREEKTTYDDVKFKMWTMRANPDNFNFNELQSTGTYLVKSKDVSLSGDIAIPEKYNNKPVVALFFHDWHIQTGAYLDNFSSDYIQDIASAFKNCSEITRVCLPATITSIPKYAFYNCSKLEEINLHNRLLNIGESSTYSFAFRGCSSLVEVNIPYSLQDVGRGAFYNCPLERFIVDENSDHVVKTEDALIIRGSLFSTTKNYNYCDETAWSQITKIAEYAVSPAQELTSLSIPYNVRAIGSRAAMGCSTIRNINFASNTNLIEIGSSAFDGVGITSLVVPDSVEDIGVYAFSSCKSLEEVILPENITSIPGNMFSSCSSLKMLCCKGYISSIGANAFADCGKFQYVYEKNAVDGDSKFKAYLKSVSGNSAIIYTNITSYISNTATPHLQSFLRSYSNYKMFYNFTATEFINSWRENDLDRTIAIKNMSGGGKLLFWTNRNELILSREDYSACYLPNNTSLISIEIVDAITLYDYSFYKNTKLKRVVLPEDLEEIKESMFEGCSNLYNINHFETVENELRIKDNFPRILSEIKRRAFYGCYSIESLDFDTDTGLTIGSHAFTDCSNLKDISFKKEKDSFVTYYLDQYSFLRCGFSRIYIPEYVDYYESFSPDVVMLENIIWDYYGSSVYLADLGDLRTKTVRGVEVKYVVVPEYADRLVITSFSCFRDNGILLDYIYVPKTIKGIEFCTFINILKTTIATSGAYEGFSVPHGYVYFEDFSCVSYKENGWDVNNRQINETFYINYYKNIPFETFEIISESLTPSQVFGWGSLTYDYDNEAEIMVLPNDVRYLKYYGTAKDIIIPNGVSSIDEDAFISLGNIFSVYVPKSVGSLDGGALSPFRNAAYDWNFGVCIFTVYLESEESNINWGSDWDDFIVNNVHLVFSKKYNWDDSSYGSITEL